MPEKFDFSKIENQEKFTKLSPEEKNQEISSVQAKALEMSQLIKEGKARSYQEAAGEPQEERQTPNTEEGQPGRGFTFRIVSVKDNFNESGEIDQSNAEEWFLKYFKQVDINQALKVKKNFHVSDKFISSPDVLACLKESLLENLSLANYSDAVEIKENLNLPDNFFNSPDIIAAIKNGYFSNLNNGEIDRTDEIRSFFPNPKDFFTLPDVMAATKEYLLKIFQRSNPLHFALALKYNYYLSEEFLSSAELLSVAKDRFIRELKQGNINQAVVIHDHFVPGINSQDLLSGIPELGVLMSRLKKEFPQLYIQAMRSVDIVIALAEFINKQEQFINQVESNPFLLEAVVNNPRYGSKLLISYFKFEEQTKDNIKVLFKIKSDILKDDPEIDPQSVEFRVLMQEKLRSYKNNQITINAIKAKGIDTEKWLNYGETNYFNLDTGGKQLDFSEAITTPMKRIKETIELYAYTVKSVLKEYRKELTDFQIPAEDAEPIEAQVKKMEEERERALLVGNEKKAEGINRGIDGLKQKIAGVKTMPLWEKLTGQINGFSRLKDDLFVAQEKLIQADKDLTEKLSGKQPFGKQMQELKQEINAAKKELRTKLKTLESRIENFKNVLFTSLGVVLGGERGEALTQEIEMKLAEQFNHYDNDCGTLTNILAARQGENNERDKMKNQPMSIFVWARNPDVDLYQGNYSPCCICIDSDIHGAESPISDYATDLSIQIVNVWDETKNEPVVAAWCFLGEDKNGDPALVIDNVEANTTYSSNFSEQLSKELLEYIQNYAESIGVPKVVLGKANNDLPTAGELVKLPEANHKYNKIGDYNRDGDNYHPSGYYFEAEDTSVKLVWEQTAKSTNADKVEKKDAKKIERIKFEGIKIADLSEKDYKIIKQLEKKIYEADGLVQGEELVTEIKEGSGLQYSVIIRGTTPGKTDPEAVGYLIAIEDETDEGDPSIYLEDIALIPEAQGQQLGWEMLKQTITKVKAKAARDGKPVLFDMHLRENSQRFMERYHNDLEQMGVKLIESVLIPDYYEDGNDALYKIYQIEA